MSTILGITDGDDGGAALVVDGRLVAAVNEERLNRLKMSIGFPRLAVREVLRLAGKTPQDVDEVAVASLLEVVVPQAKANKGWFQEASTLTMVRNDITALLAKPLGNFKLARTGYQRLKRLTMGRRRHWVRRLLKEAGVDAPVAYHDHHRCHVIAAFDASGFDEALSLSLDGGGDGLCSRVVALDSTGELALNEQESIDSIGNYYAYVTHLCGFRASIHEGKITGLAASGDPLYRDMLARMIDYRDGQIRNVSRLFFRTAISTLRQELPDDWEHKDLAASIQDHLEDVVVRYVRYWLQRSGKRNICLSGGVFANVKLNQRIADLPECDAVYVFPAMGDGGLAAGAAWSAFRRQDGYAGPLAHQSTAEHAYLGPEYDDEQIEAVLKQSGLPYQKCDPIEDVIAQLVHQGRVVARFNGRMEYGPRALGNRTILYRTSDPSVNDWLNRRLNRTEFMPFAPACLAGHEERLFHWNPASALAARYMTITLDCTEWMKQHCPAVVHIDGTARPQIVDAETNPSFHRVIQHYYELSGVPVVVNTSFNLHEEPIVANPQDAIRAYRKGKLDNMAIGSFLLGSGPKPE